MVLDASLITGIDPPHEVELVLAAINTAYNQVSSDIKSRRLRRTRPWCNRGGPWRSDPSGGGRGGAQPLALAKQLRELQEAGPGVLDSDRRNVRLRSFKEARRAIVEARA